jgi:hypothetical protein
MLPDLTLAFPIGRPIADHSDMSSTKSKAGILLSFTCMITIELLHSFRGLPSGAQLNVKSLTALAHYSARGYYDLNLEDGKTLRFIDVYSDVKVVSGSLEAAIAATC